MQRYTFRILEIRKETNDTSTIVFKQPALKKVKYQAGQYITLIFHINGRRYLRPYSFSSCPFTDKNLEITVKRVPGGIVSNHMLDILKVDDIVEAIEPLGKFLLDSNALVNNKPVIFWGAGSGITPLMSLIKSAIYNNPDRHLALIYGNRNTESVIFAQKIEDLKTLYSKFKALYFFSKAKVSENNAHVIEGRISAQTVTKVVKEYPDYHNTLHYICGPVGLKESVIEGLSILGIANNNIFNENFELVRNENDFKDIITRNVTIRKDNIETVVEVIRGKSILEAGLDVGIDLPYSCQTGDCTICKARIIRGEVKRIGYEDSIKLRADESLLCCSFPYTDDIKITID